MDKAALWHHVTHAIGKADVLAGNAIGLTAAVLVRWLSKRRARATQQRRQDAQAVAASLS